MTRTVEAIEALALDPRNLLHRVQRIHSRRARPISRRGLGEQRTAVGCTCKVESKWKRLSIVRGTGETGPSSGVRLRTPTAVTRIGGIFGFRSIPADETVRWRSLRSSLRTGKPAAWRRKAG